MISRVPMQNLRIVLKAILCRTDWTTNLLQFWNTEIWKRRQNTKMTKC